MVGLVAQRPAERVLRQRQAEILQRGHRPRRADRLDIGGVLVHRPAGPDRARHRLEVVAPVRGVRRVQRLLVRAGAGRGAAPGALADDHHVAAAAAELDGRAQAGRPAADDDAAVAMKRARG